MGNQNADTRRRELQQGRKDARAGGEPMAYGDAAGVTREVQGDQDAPFLRAPPFPTSVANYMVETLSAAFVDGNPFELGKQRDLLLYVSYTAAGDAGVPVLVLVLETLGRDDVFYPAAVVDITLTPITGIVGARTLYASELRFPGIAPGELARVAVPYDVGAYHTIRFRAREIDGGAGGALVLDMNLAT